MSKMLKPNWSTKLVRNMNRNFLLQFQKIPIPLFNLNSQLHVGVGGAGPPRPRSYSV